MAANAGVLVGARYVVACLGWLGTVVIVRRLSVAEFGRFTFVFSLLAMVSVLSEMGLGRVAIQGLVGASDDKAHFAGSLVALRFTLGVAVYGATVAFVAISGYPGEVVRTVLVAGIVILVATPSNAIEAVFQANMRMATVAVATVAGQLTQLALIVAVAVAGGSVVLFAVPAVIGELAVLAWKLAAVRRLQPIRLNIDWALWKRLLKEAAPLAAGAVMVSCYYRLDSVMLSKLDTFSSVAVYGVAYKFVDIVQYLPEALMVPVLAVLVRAWPSDVETFATTFRRALTWVALGVALVTVEFAMFSRPLISLLYGSRYEVGASAAVLVVVAECLSAFAVLAMTVFVAMGRNRLYPLAALSGLALNVVLNFWLIPLWSYHGAAAATLATNVLVVSFMGVVLARIPHLRPFPVRELAVAGAGGAAALAAGEITRQIAPWPVAVAAAALAFAIVVGRTFWATLAEPGAPHLSEKGAFG